MSSGMCRGNGTERTLHAPERTLLSAPDRSGFAHLPLTVH